MSSKISNPKNLWLFFRVVESLLLIVAGLLAIIYYQNATLKKVTFYLVGTFLVVDALIRVFRYYIEETKARIKGKGMLISALEVALGLVLIIKPDLLPNLVNQLLPMFLACFVFALAAICLTEAIILLIRHSKKVWLIVVEFIIVALLITCGVLIIYYNTTSALISAMFIILGVIFIIIGVLLLVNGFRPLDKKFEKISDHHN